MHVEASGWKGKNGRKSAIELHPELTNFYTQLANSLGASGNCEISLLKVDGDFVAGQFGLIVGDVIYILKIGYDERFRRLSPGNLLTAHTIYRLHAEGVIREINFVTDVKWHSFWRPTCRDVYEVCCYRPSLFGTTLFVFRHIHDRLSLLRRKLDPKLPRK
jgi:hypothetical protein